MSGLFVQGVQVPLLVPAQADLNSPTPQSVVLHTSQVYQLCVPSQLPALYSPSAQLRLEQVLHTKPSVMPEQLPV